MQQWLVEGGLLAISAVVCGLIVARWSAASVHAFLLPNALPARLLNSRLLAFTMFVGLGAGIVASLLPAIVTAHRDSARMLGTGRMTSGPQRVGLQRFLIGTQVALAMMLLVGAGLFVTSFRQIRAIDLGIDVDHVLFVNVDFGSVRKLSSDRTASGDANALYREMLEQIRRVPGVAHASMSAGSSFGPASAAAIFRSGTTPIQGPPTLLRPVSTDFFETMGTALVRGRSFTPDDHRLNSHVAIIDESAAKLYLPGGNGLESCVVVGRDQCTRIVGIVKDAVRWELLGEKGNVAYVPLESREDVETVTTIAVRAAGDPVALIPAVRRAVQSVSPDLPWVDIHPVRQDLDPELRPRRISASIFTTFGILALGLAAVGLYGLLAYAVTQRSHEIGVRKALGAADSGIVRMVLRGALGITLAGVAIGLVGSLAASKILASQLYGVSPRDPMILSTSAASLIVVALIAALAPVRRATRVDPVVTLRAE
jgi:putative ABC transport system permease protein